MPLFNVRCFCFENCTHTYPILVVFCQNFLNFFICTLVLFNIKSLFFCTIGVFGFVLLLIELFVAITSVKVFLPYFEHFFQIVILFCN